jgi:hypothetical protein
VAHVFAAILFPAILEHGLGFIGGLASPRKTL